MSEHTINRIANVLDSQFSGLIDMSDLARRPADQQRVTFLVRALAALCIKNLAKVDPVVAADAVTDTFQDGGLDAIHFDQSSDTLFFVQSKWSQSGDKPLDGEGARAFAEGIRDILNVRFDRFNERIRRKEAAVRAALYAERPIKLRFVTAHTAVTPTPAFVRRKIDDLVDELNIPIPLATAEHLNQADIYNLITSESQPPLISLQVGLRDWGLINRPYLAFFGRVHVGEIADWWHRYANRLFSQNLRLFYHSSEVNEALIRTLTVDPEHFWYFNNGITLICNTITKNLAGAPGNKFGVFTCDGVNIVNGAQTVGTIGTVLSATDETAIEETKDPQVWVQVRIISLKDCPPDFGRLITRAANLQNAVGNREFAAMDPQQHRLATEFALDRRRYAYKSGEPDPKGNEGCGIIEATQALGCTLSVGLAVQVKREIGVLWTDTSAPPYTELFNENTQSLYIWKAVLAMRTVDEELQRLRSSEVPKADLIAIHLNRIILYLVFQDPVVRRGLKDQTDGTEMLSAAKSAVGPIFEKVARYLERKYPSDYPANFSKNKDKCEEMTAAILNPDESKGSEHQHNLFDN